LYLNYLVTPEEGQELVQVQQPGRLVQFPRRVSQVWEVPLALGNTQVTLAVANNYNPKPDFQSCNNIIAYPILICSGTYT